MLLLRPHAHPPPHRWDVSKLEPLVAAPHSPDNRKTARECRDVKIDRVYIGSCTGAALVVFVGGGVKGGGSGCWRTGRGGRQPSTQQTDCYCAVCCGDSHCLRPRSCFTQTFVVTSHHDLRACDSKVCAYICLFPLQAARLRTSSVQPSCSTGPSARSRCPHTWCPLHRRWVSVKGVMGQLLQQCRTVSLDYVKVN